MIQLDFLRYYNFYRYHDFTFEDEVNTTHKIYDKRRKNYCDVFRLMLYREIKILKKYIYILEWLKNNFKENLIHINEKQPDDWKKYILKNMEYRRILIEDRNEWNKIIVKHKENMFNNCIECDEISCEVVEEYYELMRR